MKRNTVTIAVFLILWVMADSQLQDPINHIIKILNEERRVIYYYALPYLINNSYPGVEKYTHHEMARLGMLPPLVNVKPLIPKLGPVINDVTSFKYPIIVSGCKGNSNSRSVFIAVISATKNFLKREQIRKTWKNSFPIVIGKGLLNMARFVFVLGKTNDNQLQKKIEGESMLHKDILQIEMLDFYRYLPTKMAGLLNWINTNCPGIGFLLKVDDDVFVNMYNLANIIESYYQSGNFTIFGRSHNVGPPLFNNWGPMREGQHEIKLDAWPWNTYPNYINGPIYLMHGSTILPLLAAVQATPIIPFEDVYLTGIKTLFSSGPNSMFAHGSFDDECIVRNFVAWNDWMSLLPHLNIDNFYRNIPALCVNVTVSDKFHFTSNCSSFP